MLRTFLTEATDQSKAVWPYFGRKLGQILTVPNEFQVRLIPRCHPQFIPPTSQRRLDFFMQKKNVFMRFKIFTKISFQAI